MNSKRSDCPETRSSMASAPSSSSPVMAQQCSVTVGVLADSM